MLMHRFRVCTFTAGLLHIIPFSLLLAEWVSDFHERCFVVASSPFIRGGGGVEIPAKVAAADAFLLGDAPPFLDVAVGFDRWGGGRGVAIDAGTGEFGVNL